MPVPGARAGVHFQTRLSPPQAQGDTMTDDKTPKDTRPPQPGG